jgi:hypothetical protein
LWTDGRNVVYGISLEAVTLWRACRQHEHAKRTQHHQHSP